LMNILIGCIQYDFIKFCDVFLWGAIKLAKIYSTWYNRKIDIPPFRLTKGRADYAN